jgi:hypothetical protein
VLLFFTPLHSRPQAVVEKVIMMQPTEKQICEAIVKAMRNAVFDLFRKHKEQFYFCSLVTTGEANPPVFVAWSKEALENASLKDEYPEAAKVELKWSYADSPYYSYGNEYFEEVRHLFELRPKMSATMTPQEWESEYK